DYDGVVIEREAEDRGLLHTDPRRFVERPSEAERAALERLAALGVRGTASARPGIQRRSLTVSARILPRVVRTLLEDGWHVEADGGIYRKPGAIHLAVTSGIDWFELGGSVEFGDTVVQLPALLAAVRRGDTTVRLGDGTFGVL